jgi:hypothetical protein
VITNVSYILILLNNNCNKRKLLEYDVNILYSNVCIHNAQKPTALLSYSSAKKWKKNKQTQRHKNKLHFMVSKAIINTIIKRTFWESNLGPLNYNQTHYQLSHHRDLEGAFSFKIYNVTVRKVKHNIVFINKKSNLSTFL